MDTDALKEIFFRIVDTVTTSTDVNDCWQNVLSVTGQLSNERLASAAIKTDSSDVARQLELILENEPIPTRINLVWFGLFDGLAGSREYSGFYVAGWHSEQELAAGGTPSFFPQHRYLTSRILNLVKQEALSAEQDGLKTILDYAVMFGAAATLSRFAATQLQLVLPVYVGFDSGDFARVK